MIPECLYMDLSPIFIPCPFYSFFTHLTPEYDPWHTLSHNGLLASFPSPNFFPASKTMLMPLLSLECFPFPPVKSNASLMLNCQLHSALKMIALPSPFCFRIIWVYVLCSLTNYMLLKDWLHVIFISVFSV